MNERSFNHCPYLLDNQFLMRDIDEIQLLVEDVPMAAPSPQTTKRRMERTAEPRDVRERQLIDAALHCISTLGLRDTTVQQVAARARMAVGSISQYFGGKNALLTAVLRQLSEEFQSAWQQELARCAADPALRLRSFVLCYFEPALCQPKKIAVWFAFWGEVKARPRYRAVCSGFDATHDATLEGLCAELIASGGCRDLDAGAAAKIIASLCHGLWLEMLTGAGRPKRDELARLALRGLAAMFPKEGAFQGHSSRLPVRMNGAR
jgi:TetR/AcrR family transcriptional repressor of bet genes